MVIILALKEHLWRHVLVGSAEGGSFDMDILCGPSEIADFDIAVVIEQ